MKRHGEEAESNICSYCGKNFKNKVNLKSHTRLVHLRESKFNCSHCGRLFKDEKNLTVSFDLLKVKIFLNS